MKTLRTLGKILATAACALLSYLPLQAQETKVVRWEYSLQDKKYDIRLVADCNFSSVKDVEDAKKQVLNPSVHAALLIGTYTDEEIATISNVMDKIRALNPQLLAQTEPLIVKVNRFEDYRMAAGTISNFDDFTFDQIVMITGCNFPASKSYINRLEEERRKAKIPESEKELTDLIAAAQEDTVIKDNWDILLLPPRFKASTLAHELGGHALLGDLHNRRTLLKKIDEVNDGILSGTIKQEGSLLFKSHFVTTYAEETAKNAYQWVEERVRDVENSISLIRGLSTTGVGKIEKAFQEEIDLQNSKITDVESNFSGIEKAFTELGFPTDDTFASSKKAVLDYMTEKKRHVELRRSAVRLYSSTRERTFQLYRDWLNELSIKLQNEEEAAELIAYHLTGHKESYRTLSPLCEQKKTTVVDFLKGVSQEK